MAANSKNFVILACTVLTQYNSVTDKRTDRRTPRHAWLRRANHSAIARKNSSLPMSCRTACMHCLKIFFQTFMLLSFPLQFSVFLNF